MRARFYRDNKKNVVRAVFESGSRTCFSATKKEIGDFPIFKDGSSKTIKILSEASEKKIAEIAKKHAVEMILVCSKEFFDKLLKSTNKQEIEVDFYITNSREILHYAFVSFETAEKSITTAMVISSMY